MHGDRRWKVALMTVAAVGIVGLEAYALYRGVDGAALASSFAALGGIVGWFGGRVKK